MPRHCRVESPRRSRARATSRHVLALAAALMCWIHATNTSAFSDPVAYTDPVDVGGGAGRWFTGSPADGFACNVCHTGQAGVDLVVSGLPTDGYMPGRGYEVSVTWPPFVKDLALIAEFTNEDRSGAGTLELPRPDALKPAELCEVEQGGGSPAAIQTGDNQRQLVSVVDCGAKLVRFRWTAPLMAAGPIWFNAGFVVSNQDAAPTGDGVTLIARPLAPVGSPLGTDKVAQSGCSAVPRSPRVQPLIWIVPLAAAFARRRISRRKGCKP
jgi:hypothetical protein